MIILLVEPSTGADSFFFFFFIQCKAEQPLQGTELQEKEEGKR